MDEIIAILRNDTALWSLLGKTAQGNPKLYPWGEGSTIEECATYEFYTNREDGIKAIDVLNITVVTYSMGKSNNALKRIKELILTIGDKQLTGKVLKVVQNGGGSLTNQVGDKTMYHFKAYFYITRRV